MSKEHRLAQEYCRDTCPAVDDVLIEWMRKHDHLIPPALHAPLDALVQGFKDAGTNKLRDALVTACRDLLDAESREGDLKDEIEAADRRVADLQSELESVREAA